MKTHFGRVIVSMLALGTCLAGWAIAGDFCCCLCGRSANCHKRCRLVCEEKKVEIVCWGCKCEDFCAPGCSKPGCEHCEEVCQSCNDPNDKSGVCCESKPFYWKDWIPFGSAHIYTKHKLHKKIETKKVPVYKWVVEDVCDQCQEQVADQGDASGNAALPPAPPADNGPAADKTTGKKSDKEPKSAE